MRGRPRPASRGAAVGLGPALARTLALAALAAACGAQPVVLLNASGTGNADEPFVASSGWEVAWSYDCAATGGHGIFALDVFNAGGTPDFAYPGVTEEGDKDAGVYRVRESGRFYLEVTTTCRWTVKVSQSQG